ncbi:MAG: nitrogen fixation protein NifA [Epsilonproteobacteria bacterium]|nr:MAG: nitrogen fixation protein NifA [Campylobacterota bacterium]
MINWNSLGDLHAIKKLGTIVKNWFDLDTFYCDSNQNLKSLGRPQNLFLKLLIEKIGGEQSFSHELKRSLEILGAGDVIFELAGCKGIALDVVIEGEIQGKAIAYPFLGDNTTSGEAAEIIQELISVGASKAEATEAVKKIKRPGPQDQDKLVELVTLVAEEITDYQDAQNKRDELVSQLSSELSEKYRYHNIIGKSKEMQKIYSLLDKIKKSESNILIEGDNGTGKELVAKAIHYNSPRSEKLFLEVNCSAFNENLLDSELFGHVKGAFTGAIKDKPGLFEMVDGGTIFLDEIGDTSLAMQVKLLRVIQEGTFLSVGGTSQKHTDVRVICATNKNIKEIIITGEFREDLYYRLNVINVNLPPLRNREGDIPLLMEYFLKKRCDSMGVALKDFAKKTKEKMLNYSWPGNVRELENEIERLVVLSGDEKNITPDSLSPRILEISGIALAGEGAGFVPTSGGLKKAVAELERVMIGEGLTRCSFNKSRLAKELGISRASLIMKVEKYGLDKRKSKEVA